ncbi:hypothetical protein [Mycobacterium paraffinicum]|nr:hypothetical protein [Mycobacterium paraffinicum]
MTSSDLFSHRYEPEVVSHAADSEPVQNPIFSDGPKKDSASTTQS